MGRNRVIYQSEALFCATGIDDAAHQAVTKADQLLRVQDISHGVELNRTDINEFGQLTAIDRQIIEPPTVNLDFSYYLHGGRNERLLKFEECTNRNAGTGGLENAMQNFLSGDVGQNFYISVAKEGDDAKTTAGANLEGVIGIGNGYITNYSVEAAVGDIPSASVTVEANNLRFKDSGDAFQNPAINLSTGENYTGTHDIPAAGDTASTSETDANVVCLRPGDITVDFNDDGNARPGSTAGADDKVQGLGGARLEGDGQMHLQNFTLDVPMARTALNRIGSRFPYAREIDVPATITFSCSAFLGDIEDGNLNDVICSTGAKRNIRIKIMQPCTQGGQKSNFLGQEFLLKGCTLESQNFSASIGDNKTVDLVWSAQVAGANDKLAGLFMWYSNAGVEDVSGETNSTVNPTDG